ncbi:hypothetical protein [Macrococcoides canis]|uniref:hypothetical protein n=1 Tax=Macrococcoides canis TaxID=1855823 RepID=UPI0020B69D4A|nr:hypothetical protein [Macrococcus canis]UTG99780.1 hypothetical protein KFV04_09950 [Macrococcus canis]WBF53230.1 hypothetical protein LL975_02555 [Macrococcus canis]
MVKRKPSKGAIITSTIISILFVILNVYTIINAERTMFLVFSIISLLIFTTFIVLNIRTLRKMEEHDN